MIEGDFKGVILMSGLTSSSCIGLLLWAEYAPQEICVEAPTPECNGIWKGALWMVTRFR